MELRAWSLLPSQTLWLAWPVDRSIVPSNSLFGEGVRTRVSGRRPVRFSSEVGFLIRCRLTHTNEIVSRRDSAVGAYSTWQIAIRVRTMCPRCTAHTAKNLLWSLSSHRLEPETGHTIPSRKSETRFSKSTGSRDTGSRVLGSACDDGLSSIHGHCCWHPPRLVSSGWSWASAMLHPQP